MDPFFGKWKVLLEKNEGLAEIGKQLGWTEEKEKMLSSLDYTMLLEPSGDSLRCFLDYGTTAPSREFLFKLGEPFEYIGAEGSKAKCVVVIEDGKMKENYTSPEGATWQTFREVDGNNMKATTKFDHISDLTCAQYLVRV